MKTICPCLLITVTILLFSGRVFAQTYVFIPNSGDDSVVIFATSDNQVAATIDLPAGSRPYAAAVAPDGSYAFVVNTGNGTVTVVDTAQIANPEDVIETTINVGSEPRGVAVDPNSEYVYVTNYASDSLSIINTGNFQVNTIEDVGSGPWGVIADPDGEHIYVLNHLDDSLAVITTDSRVVVNDIGDGPVDLIIDDERDRIYATCTNDGTLAVLGIRYPDDDDEEIVLTLLAPIAVDTGPWGVALTPSKDDLYVSHDAAGSVLIIDAEDTDDSISLSVASGLRGIASAINGDTMYLAGEQTDIVYQIDLETQILGPELSGFSAPVAMGQFIGGWPPEAPSELRAKDVDEDSIKLEWTDNAWDEVGFKIQRKDSNDEDDDFITIARVGENVTAYKNGGLDDDHGYVYRVRAYNEAGDSAPASVHVTTDEEPYCFIGVVSRP